MRKNWEVDAKLKRVRPEGTPTQVEEDKTIEKLMQLAPKVFLGLVAAVYGYVILDTWRQVTVEQSKYIDQEG